MSRKKIKQIRLNPKRTKKIIYNFRKKISSKCSWDRRVQIWQKYRSFSPRNQKIFHSKSKSGWTFQIFLNEIVSIRSFLWILWMQFWPNWQKVFIWKFKKYSVKIREQEERNLSKKETFFLQNVRKLWIGSIFTKKLFSMKCSFGHIKCTFVKSAVKLSPETWKNSAETQKKIWKKIYFFFEENVFHEDVVMDTYLQF